MAGLLRFGLTATLLSKASKSLCYASKKSYNDTNPTLARCFATSSNWEQKNRLDRQIQKLDQDVRRSGRITKREIENVLAEIKISRTATSTQSLLVIRCCGNLISEEIPERRTKLVQDIWSTLNDLGVLMDVSHYNALLRVYLENKHEFAPSEILEELEQKGISPNRVTYQRLITRYCQKGDIEGATRILEFMREKGIPVNESVFNALILGHSEANDMESAEGIVGVMKQAGLEPTAETYTLLICGYIKANNFDKVKSLLSECEKSDIYLIDKDYLEIIYALAVNNHDDKVDEILGKVRKSAGYNQEVVNSIYRLCGIKKYEIAFKLLKSMARPTRMDGTTIPTGAFFIRYLVKNNAPLELILRYTDEMAKEGLNPLAYQIAMEGAVKGVNWELAVPLFKNAKEKGFPVRQHYFWPFIQKKAKADDYNGILDVLNTMNTQLGMPANTETLREYAVPALAKKFTNPDELVLQLKSCGVPIAATVSSMVINYLEGDRIKDAADLASRYNAFYTPFFIRRPLSASFAKTRDLESFITLLKQICLGLQWHASQLADLDKHDDDGLGIPDHSEFVGQIVADLARKLAGSPDQIQVLESVLKGLVENGLAMTNNGAEMLQTILQGKLTSEISALLEKLTMSDMSFSSSKSTSTRFPLSNADPSTLERLIEVMELKGESTLSIKKQLFNAFCRSKNLEKALQLKEELEKNDFVFTPGMYANLIDNYVSNEKLSEALDVYNSIRQKEPDFQLHSTKLLRLVLLMLQNDKVDDALKLLEEREPEGDLFKKEDPGSQFANNTICWRILNNFAEKGDLEKVKKFFNVLVDRKFIEVNNVLLGPLIKVHIVNNDLTSALNEFEEICRLHRVTPWKTELLNKFIELEDANSLQRITDLSTQIHGEVNSLYDLMLAFLESGRTRQAKKILETPGLRVRKDRVQSASNRFQNDGDVASLEKLLEVTRDMPVFDRDEVYYDLLVTYGKADDWEKSFSLWTQMQDEDVQPTDAFLVLLADILKRHGKEVPFSVPASTDERPPQKESFDSPRLTPQMQEFRKLVKSGKLDDALALKSKLSGAQLSNVDISLLVESLLNANRYNEAKECVLELVNKGLYPMTRVLKFFLIRASIAGDVDSIAKIEQRLPGNLQKFTLLSNRKCTAYVSAGRAKEFVDELEAKLDAISSNEEFDAFLETFPKGGLIRLLDQCPDLVPQVERICHKCNDRKNSDTAPMNVLWSYYFLTKNYEKADHVWNNYLKSAPNSIIFNSIVKRAEEGQDTQQLERLIETLNTASRISPRALALVYSSLLDIYVKQDKAEKADELLKESLTKVSLDHLKTNTLVLLKSYLISKGIDNKFLQWKEHRKS